MSHGLELLFAFEEQGWSRGESTRLPLINVTRVQIPASTPYVGWVCCWFSPLRWEVFHRVLRFSPLLKNHWTLPTSNSTWNVRTRLNELIKSASWVNKLQVTNLYHDIFEQERTFSLDWKHYILLVGNIISPLFGATPPNLIWTNSKVYIISPVELWAGLENLTTSLALAPSQATAIISTCCFNS